jgi:predicted metalloprotease with PDZ domain
MTPMTRALTAAAVALAAAVPRAAVASAAAPNDSSVSAPIADVHYELTFDSAAAAARIVKVAMSFRVAGSAPVLLALPAWAPGHYTILNFARRVLRFGADQDGRPVTWDKYDYATWRVRPAGPGTVRVAFDYAADTLDDASTWAGADFLLVNGTNLFPYPRGRDLDFAATVTVRTRAGWRVATGMHPGGAPLTYRESSYHDLVDMPLFVGRFDLDSSRISGKWTRLASYPAGRFAPDARRRLWRDVEGTVPAESRVFGVTPWDDYTIFMIFDDSFPGGSALEHQSSNVGIYMPQLIGTPILTNVVAHEMFHAWNVKRLRPAAMVPYRYDVPEPTPLLWVSEGFTVYYADLAQLRSGDIDSVAFLRSLYGHIEAILSSPPTSVEDASLSTWIRPEDGSAYLYYDKGAVLGMLLDVMIRDRSDNRGSLDDVMRDLYEHTYLRGRGFTTAEFWAAASRAAGGYGFDAFDRRYVDGRDSLPYDSVLTLAGIRFAAQSIRAPRLGISSAADSSGVRVTMVVPNSAYAEAGGAVNDTLLSVGGVDVRQDGAFELFRERWTDSREATLPVVIRRAGRETTLQVPVRLTPWTTVRVTFDPQASPKALRIRGGLLHGATDR